MAKQTDTQKLLAKQLPVYRQAYSDRTAWQMACLSELAYIKFNKPPKIDVDLVADAVKKVGLGKHKLNLMKRLLDSFEYDSDAEMERLVAEVKLLNMSVVKTFDCDGTQAILVKNDKFICLAFRGTESNSIKDIKSDVDASLTGCESGGRIHRGFDQAFDKVATHVQAAINNLEYSGLPLFITGHSLGGALATIATKKLVHSGGIAACYTFGAPRVGDEDWIHSIKDPIYRIVNSADCVTMLPPAGTFIDGVACVLQFIPVVKEFVPAFKKRFGQYMHGGYMRYLINCENGFDGVKILFSVSLVRRLRGW